MIKENYKESNKINNYLLIMLFLMIIIGTITGTVSSTVLEQSVNLELRDYLDGFVDLYVKTKIDSNQLLTICLTKNFKYYLAIFLLGISIIGIPFIFIILGIRSFITGFCVGILFQNFSINILGIILFDVLLKEIMIIPILLVLSLKCVKFSLSIIKSLFDSTRNKINFKKVLGNYLIFSSGLGGIFFIVTLIETYIIPPINTFYFWLVN